MKIVFFRESRKGFHLLRSRKRVAGVLLGMLCVSMCMSLTLSTVVKDKNTGETQVTTKETPHTAAAWTYTAETSFTSRPMVITDLDADNNTELWTFENTTLLYKVYEWTAPDTNSLIFSEDTLGNEHVVANFHEVLQLDYNRDGYRDVLVASSNLTDAHHFTPYHGYTTDNAIYSWGYNSLNYIPDQAIGLDFDKDGNTEYIVSAVGGNCRINEVINDIPEQLTILSSSEAIDLATCGDFDKDGTGDFFTGGSLNDPYIRMFEYLGDELYNPVWSMPSGSHGSSLGTGDSDGDGANELFVNDLYGNNVSVLECTGNNALTFRTQFDSPGGFGCFDVVDTDANGQFEIIFEVNSSLGYKQVRDYEATADNTWVSKWNSTDIAGVAGNVFAIDIDKDLYCEIITNSLNNTLVFQCNVVNGTLNPPTGLSVSINGGAIETRYRNVTLTLGAMGATEMCFSNDNLTYSSWESYGTTKAWNLTAAGETKTVYFRARNSQGTADAVWDTIVYIAVPAAPTLQPFTPNTTYQKRAWLNWTQVELATNYSIYRELSPISDVSGLTPIINVSSFVKSYLDCGVESGNIYYYVVTAFNAEGVSDPSACQSVNVTVPNLFQKLFILLSKVDPLTKEIISKGINFIGNITGSDVVGFLTANGDVVISRVFGLGDMAAEMGIFLEFGIGLRAHFVPAENRVEFTFSVDFNTGFELNKLQFKEPFSIVAKVLQVMDKMGVSVAAKLIAQLYIKFYFDADDLSFGIMNICVRINPSIEFTVKLIPLILNLKPEVKQVIDFIQKPIAKYLKYDFYNIIVTKVELGVNLVAQYDAVHGIFIADAQLVLNIKAELDLFQKSKVKIPEIALRLEGLVGVHFNSGGSPKLSLCGTLTMVARVNTGECGLLKYVINPLLNRVGFSPNKDHPFPIASLGSGCSGLVTCTPLPAADDPDNDSDYLTDAEETALGTNVTHPDTDNDGIWDYLEVQLGSNPLSADTDNDTISDYDEYFVIHSNLLSNDTDGDGLFDAAEMYILGTDLCANDTDMDGLFDSEEILLYGTDPLNNDTDGDGYEDGIEQLWYNTDPNYYGSIPLDTDGDGLLNKDEIEIYHTYANIPDTSDTDGDLLDNIQEMLIGSDLNAADTDNDGLSDYAEYYTYHTYFGDADSDGDGFTDGDEVRFGFDPLNSISNIFVWIFPIATIAIESVAAIYILKYKRRKEAKSKLPEPTPPKTGELEFE